MFTPDTSYRAPSGTPHYYAISIRKLVLLSIASFGAFQVLWHYRNWWAVRLRTGARVSPIWRSLFFWLFAYSLFRRIRTSADEHGVASGFSPAIAAVVTATFALFWRLDEAFWFTIMLTILPLVVVQKLVNRVNEVVAPRAELDQRLTRWQLVTVPLGSLGFGLALLGTVGVAF